VLLDEIERDSIAPRGLRSRHWYVELDGAPGSHLLWEWAPCPVPDDRVPEWIEPVVRELEALPAARAPRSGARVLEPQARTTGDTGAWLFELVGEPSNRERSDWHRMLTDSLHQLRATTMAAVSPVPSPPRIGL
jgi:hypothetical protein